MVKLLNTTHSTVDALYCCRVARPRIEEAQQHFFDENIFWLMGVFTWKTTPNIACFYTIFFVTELNVQAM